MQITMIKTVPGSVDGCRVSLYQAGEVYDLGGNDGERALATAFVEGGLAEEFGAIAPDAGKQPKAKK